MLVVNWCFFSIGVAASSSFKSVIRGHTWWLFVATLVPPPALLFGRLVRGVGVVLFPSSSRLFPIPIPFFFPFPFPMALVLVLVVLVVVTCFGFSSPSSMGGALCICVCICLAHASGGIQAASLFALMSVHITARVCGCCGVRTVVFAVTFPPLLL